LTVSAAPVFGGNLLTATDLAVAAGLADLGDSRRAGRVDRELVRGGLDAIAVAVAGVGDRVRTSPEPLPLVAVGGGSILTRQAAGFRRGEPSRLLRRRQRDRRRIAQVGGEVDRIFALGPRPGRRSWRRPRAKPPTRRSPRAPGRTASRSWRWTRCRSPTSPATRSGYGSRRSVTSS